MSERVSSAEGFLVGFIFRHDNVTVTDVWTELDGSTWQIRGEEGPCINEDRQQEDKALHLLVSFGFPVYYSFNFKQETVKQIKTFGSYRNIFFLFARSNWVIEWVDDTQTEGVFQ